jgi:hypothetical protein
VKPKEKVSNLETVKISIANVMYWEDEMGRLCRTYGRDKNAYEILVGITCMEEDTGKTKA